MTESTDTDPAVPNVPYPHFQVNLKVYPGTYGEDALEFARLLERIETDTGGRFVLTPQLPDLRAVVEATDLAVTAPYVDAVEPGPGMGRILPETLADAGADGVVINHPERPDSLSDVARKIERCQDLGMDAMVCVDTVRAGRAVAGFDPDALVYEVAADIGSDRAVTRARPDRVGAFLDAIEDENPRTRVLVGGGISTPADVGRAFELGADATGAASAVALADDPEPLLRGIAEVLPPDRGYTPGRD